MSSSLLDLAIDLINDAKGSDSKNGLYLLEQVKEIALHRDRNVLFEVFPTVVDDFMLRPSVPIRKFLVSFASEAMEVDKEKAYPHFLSLAFFLLNDESEALQTLLTKEFAKYRSEIIILISTRPAVVAAGEMQSNDPKNQWQQLCTVTARLCEPLNNTEERSIQHHDRRIVQCLRLYEAIAVFGIPEEQQTVAATKNDPRLAARSRDPRLRRNIKQPDPAATSTGATAGNEANAGKSANTGSTSLTAERIPLHHPFINRNEIISAAQETYSQLLQWASSFGPEDLAPFNMALMAQLLHSLIIIGSVRQQHAIAVAKILILSISQTSTSEEQKHLESMSKEERLNLARAIHRFLRAAAHTADPDSQLTKLRAAVGIWESQTAVGMKRSLSVADGDDSSTNIEKASADVADEDDGEDSKSRREAAVAAVNAAESRLQSLSKLSTSAVTGTKGKKSTSKKGTGVDVNHVSVGEYTELSAELAPLMQQQHTAALKVANAVISDKTTNILTLQAIPLEARDYATLAEGTLIRLLENYPAMEDSGDSMAGAFALMCVRSMLSMIKTEVAQDGDTNFIPIPIISSLAAAASSGIKTSSTKSEGKHMVLGNDIKNIAVETKSFVMLPRSVWIFLSFSLYVRRELSVDPAIKTAESAKKVKLFLMRFCAMYFKSCLMKEQKPVEEKEDVNEGLLRDVYNAICLVAVSRIVQSTYFSPSAAEFLLSLPSVPMECVSLLKLLMLTGSRGAADLSDTADESAVASSGASIRARGVRVEALRLLGRLIFANDQSSARHALLHLLWCCISDDFEIRSRAVPLVINEVLQVEDWCDQIVIRFSLQAAATAVLGVASISAFLEDQKREASSVVASEENVSPDAVEMEVETKNDIETIEADVDMEVAEETVNHPFPSLRDALYGFDNGIEFGGLFSSESVDDSAEQKQTVVLKRCMHLLSQICVTDSRALTTFSSLYCLARRISYKQQKCDSMDDTDTSNEAVLKARDTDVCSLLQMELRDVLPLIRLNTSPVAIFKMLSDASVDTGIISNDMSNAEAVRPLLQYVLEILHSDYSSPATPDMVMAVSKFIKAVHTHTEPIEEQEINNEEAVVDKNTDTIIPHSCILNDSATDEIHMHLLLPLMGAFPGNEIVQALPRIINMFSQSSSTNNEERQQQEQHLNAVFMRIVKSRPPPLTKASLLVALHRLPIIEDNSENIETETKQLVLPMKVVLDAIALCLSNKSEFSGDVLRDTLRQLLQDEQFSFALMRTAILSAQSFGEVKRFVLSDVIPKLIRGRVWSTASRLWEGVIFAAKNLAASGFKNSEHSLRALLGLPAAQLKEVLIAAPNVKLPMTKLLQTLSAEEKEEVISGQWVGLYSETSAATDTEGDANPLPAASKVDTAKAEIIAEIEMNT